MLSKELLAFAAGISSASATIYQGFNYGSNADFDTEFALAKSLVGTSGAFTSARLYTTIQENTVNTPTAAIQAAIDQDVSLLLGIWASAGQAAISNEIAALKAAISTYGTAFTSRVVGISVGSEDLYRITPTGIANMAGVGAEPTELVSYIAQVRAAIAGTTLSGAPVGHVDTWTGFANSSNDAVVAACDFLGMDAYPYFQTTEANGVSNGYDIFFSGYDQTVAFSQGKPVWVTETGWPVSGPASADAVASTANAETYWQAVACKLLGATNTWWYTLNDYGASPSFGVTTGGSTPLYDLTCGSSSSSSSSSASATASSTAASSASGASTASAVATTTGAAASSSVASSAASVSAFESTATPSNSVVSVSSTVPATVAIGGSPADKSSSAADSVAASIQTASSSYYSSVLASASSAVSAASTDSTATIAASVGSSAATSGAPATSAVGGTTMATSSAVVGATMATSSAGVATSASGVATGSSTGVPSYTGGASTLRSTGGFVAAVVALIAAL